MVIEQHVLINLTSHHNLKFYQKSAHRPMWFTSLLLASLFFVDLSSACCCSIYQNCRCNIFGCNCDTDNGWCFKIKAVCKLQNGCSHEQVSFECKSSKNRPAAEYCPHRRRRIKRSVTAAILKAYSGLYGHLIERSAMEKFLCFDQNQDGLFSLEEAIVSNRRNATVEEFEQVDVDNDGFVHPSEFDASLL